MSKDDDGLLSLYMSLKHMSYAQFRSTAKSRETAARVDELSKVMGGTNIAAGIRTPTAGARNLNMDDLHYYLHNRKRVLVGQKAHTPEEWFEAVR